MKPSPPAVQTNPWRELRAHTAARIALGRAGASLPTAEVLRFGLEHAQARDAVHLPLDTAKLRADCEAQGWPVMEVKSRAPDRAAYLARPDWGRSLDSADAAGLRGVAAQECDLAFVLSDGLSALALQSQALPLLSALRPMLEGLRLAPLVIATQARVALADEVGELLKARIAVSVIGERPGLSSPDSLGIYLTHAPRVGRNDAERNCISNIRPQGLPYADAALQLAALIRTALRAQLSGVNLKFDSGRPLAAP